MRSKPKSLIPDILLAIAAFAGFFIFSSLSLGNTLSEAPLAYIAWGVCFLVLAVLGNRLGFLLLGHIINRRG